MLLLRIDAFALLRTGGDSLPFVKGNFEWNGAFDSMGAPPPSPLGFNAFGQTGGTGAAETAPVSLHMGQRSGRIPALPYPLPVRLRV